MFAFFRTRGSQEARDSHHPSMPSRQQSQMRTATQRELVRVVLRDTMRMHGIPLDWLGCEMLNLSARPDDNSLMIQLVIRRWNEGLLRFAAAFQDQLLLGLQRFDPASDHTRHEVVWKFSPDCECPYPTMPTSDYWTAPQQFQTTLQQPFDLPDTLPSSEPDSGFAPTVPGKLL